MSKSTPSPLNDASESEIRKHYYRERFVIIAPKRNMRPDSFSHDNQAHKIPDLNCHFCHNHEHPEFALPSAKDWRVRVVKNAFPALSLQNTKAFGTQEVVIETAKHGQEFSELSLDHMQDVFSAFIDRLEELKQIKGVRYVLVFKNDGPTAGASVAHAHSQIMAVPMIPPHIETEADDLNHYWNEHNSCALCDVITWEERQKVRVVFADKHIVAVSPYAAAHGFGVWVIPRRHVTTLGALGAGERESLAVVLKKVTARLDSANLSFNFYLQESIPDQDHHFVLKIEPHTFKFAGAELGTGIVINPVAPEYAALWYHGKV